MIARYRFATLACLLLLLLLPLTLFHSVTLGNNTLLPADNLFAWEPFRSSAPVYGVTQPQNQLLSDLILENYPWKRFIIDSIQQRQLPLWNPYLFAGMPFLAAGQHSALYPPSILYYILPLEKAYGWFTALNLGLAGIFMFVFMRAIGLRRRSSLFAGVAYQLSGFMVASVVFQMVIASAAWLPLILAMAERIIHQSSEAKQHSSSVPWVVIGSIAITMHILAGHVEITVYTALITAAYSAWRLGMRWLHARKSNAPQAIRQSIIVPALWLIAMALIGAGMSGIQLIPLFELVQSSFRAARSSLQEVMGYGYPPRHILLWLMPNFYGNPSQHSFFDIFTGSMQPVTTASGNTEWGIKNFVEGAVYVGIITLSLAVIGIVAALRRILEKRPVTSTDINNLPRHQPAGGFFIVLGVLAVLLAFGTPVYALLYYGLPGINQLHSPFRWVYALTLCFITLAAMGLDHIIESASTSAHAQPSYSRLGQLLRSTSIAGIAGSILLVVVLGVVRLYWSTFEPYISKLFTGLAKANDGFVSSATFYSYETVNISLFALLLAVSCAIILARKHAHKVWWSILIIGLLVFDYNIAWTGFNPSVDPRLLRAKPDAIEFLQKDTGQWRLTTYDPTGEKPLNANTAWLYNLQDIRGYDSIIPKQYVDYMELIEPQTELPYNRISPLSKPESLESPLLDMLNVKYILTPVSVTVKTPGMTEVFTGDGVRIYRNERVMPRAFTLPASSALLTNNFGRAVQKYDPRKYVMIDATCGITDAGCAVPRAGQYTPANISSYGNNEVWIDAQITQTSWLMLTDSYFPGWRAFVRPFGGTDKDEHEVTIGLANGNFRAVKLSLDEQAIDDNASAQPLGSSGLATSQSATSQVFTIRFKYSPDAVRIGAFTSFIAFVALLLISGMYLWRRFYHEGLMSSPIRRIAKNSLVLTSFNLVGRIIDFAFAIIMLRFLGPEGAGKYAFAVVIIGWFEILMNFGLNTFLTREVARDRAHANKYLYNTSILRLLLGAGTAPLVLLVIIIWRITFGLADDTAIAITLLAVSQIISSMTAGLSALFLAYEKAELPAVMTIVSTLIKVSLGVMALLSGFGIIGLAGSSLITNAVTLVILLLAAARIFFTPYREGDPAMRRSMLRESFPLMLNHLLATLFFKIDVPLLEAMRSATVVGWYSAAYKFVDAFNIIPAFFTQSIFPAMSRQAKEDSNSMARSFVLSLKLLVITALPIAILTTAFAPYMIEVLGGPEFLPHSATALTLMIWSIPFGWINSITNYALIAVNQQRALTRAFIIGLAFNIIANLIFIPLYSYQAAAVITILSEIVEGAAFYLYVRRYIVKVNWFDVLGRPALAAASMAVVITISAQFSLLLPGTLIGLALYTLVIIVVRVITPADQQLLAPIIPARFRLKTLPKS